MLLVAGMPYNREEEKTSRNLSHDFSQLIRTGSDTDRQRDARLYEPKISKEIQGPQVFFFFFIRHIGEL